MTRAFFVAVCMAIVLVSCYKMAPHDPADGRSCVVKQTFPVDGRPLCEDLEK